MTNKGYSYSFFNFFIWTSFLITWPLISFGAFVRLHGAGMVCPDWPLCNGEILPDPVFTIWLEVGHRYVAGLLLISIFISCILTFINDDLKKYKKLTVGAFILVIVQAIFGALTVWFYLNPISVTVHLILGNTLFFICTLLLIFHSSQKFDPNKKFNLKLFLPFILFIVIITSGGINSSTYSGYACDSIPLCSADDPLSFSIAELHGETISNSNDSLNLSAIIHLGHRLIAILGGAFLIIYSLIQARDRSKLYLVIIALIIFEIIVGFINALYMVPIPISALHTAIAATICGFLAWDTFESYKRIKRH